MKPVIIKKEFHEEGDFQSMYAAQHWLKENGYDYGSSSVLNPTAIMKGNYDDYPLPWKMKNFTAKEKKMVHGIITGDMRNGPVKIELYE